MCEHLGEYLDEFIFRFNRRNSRHRGLVFMRLIQRAVSGGPVTYRDLVRDPHAKAVPPPGSPGRGPNLGPWKLSHNHAPGVTLADRPL